MSHKNLNLNLLINCISARSATQILSIKGECNYRFLHFLIIGLSKSSDNSLFEIYSFLIPLPEADLSCVAKIFDRASEADFFSNLKCFITQLFIRSCFSN